MKDETPHDRTAPNSSPAVERQALTALHRRLLAELVAPGDWWNGAQRRAIVETARSALDRSGRGRAPDSAAILPGAAVEVVLRVVTESGQLDRSWADAQIEHIGDARYAEVVGVTATAVAIDVTARSIGEPVPGLPDPVAGEPAGERPSDVGDVGAWIPMTAQKVLANVSRALSLVPRTNATWRALVTESYSRGPEMMELRWHRALTRPQVELIASEVSRLQDCFY